jgi:hypothetical protein
MAGSLKSFPHGWKEAATPHGAVFTQFHGMLIGCALAAEFSSATCWTIHCPINSRA